MWLLAADFNWIAFIAALATLLGAISGCMLSYAAVVKARREATSEAEVQCEKRLKEARRDAEELAEQLHQARMRR